MTATVRDTRKRTGIVYAHTTRRVDRRGMPTGGTEEGYVGQSRQSLEARTAQHMGRKPNRDGTLCPQPWSDLEVSDRIVEQGVWTGAQLDAREQYWIAKLKPRYNWEGNDGPWRVGVTEARRQRDARDRAAGLPVRAWPPLRSDRAAAVRRVTTRQVSGRRRWWPITPVWLGVLILSAAVGVPGGLAVLLAFVAAGVVARRAWGR